MRYIVGFLIGIGLIVLMIVLIFRIFSGGGDEARPRVVDLNSYSTTDTVMRLTMDGPIVADTEHQQIRITVGRDQVLFESLRGYQGDVAATRSYVNNPDAYAEFLRALTLQGYTSGNLTAPKDERGYCPTGQRFVYEAIGDGENILRWWSTSCGQGQGNFNGRPADVRNLFKRQIPDYRELTRDLSFS